MQSEKPIYKKPWEKINHYKESTWVGNDKPMFENKYCGVFQDKYPVVKGHLLFVPKKKLKASFSHLPFAFGPRSVVNGLPNSK